MPILYRYLLTLFLGGFFKILGVMIGLFFLLDGAEQIRRFARKSVAWQEVVWLMFLRMPGFLVEFLPSLALLATLLVISRLARQNEITVMRAGTISIYRVLIPFLLGGGILALGHLLLQDQIVPHTNRTADALMKRLKKEQHETKVHDSQDLWLREGLQIIHAKQVSAINQVLLEVSVFYFDHDFKLMQRLDARKGEFREGAWILYDGVVYRFDQDIAMNRFDAMPWPVQLQLEQLNRETPLPETLSILQLKRFADRLEQEGYNATPYRAMLHRKISDPVTTFASIVLAFPFALRLPRQGQAARSMLFGLLVGFVMFIVVDLFTALGLGGGIPPILAGWLPPAAIAGIGIFLLARLEERAGH